MSKATTNVSKLNALPSGGGAVTQLTNKSTAVVLNTQTGKITMNAATLNTGSSVQFTVINSTVTANSVVLVQSGTNSTYTINCYYVTAGSFNINVSNNTGSNLSEAIVINFVVLTSFTS